MKINSEILLDNLEVSTVQQLDKKSAIEDAIRQVLVNVGENPDRDGLLKTPYRVAKMFIEELFAGYSEDLKTIVNGALYEAENQDEMVIVEEIDYSSMCEHHMLPFIGKAHIAYIPSNKIIGLSKIPRIVDMFARRLQVQERLTNEIADAIEQILNPVGVAIIVDGKHSCASLRGVKKQGAKMRTVAYRGEFRNNLDLRNEFFQLSRSVE